METKILNLIQQIMTKSYKNKNVNTIYYETETSPPNEKSDNIWFRRTMDALADVLVLLYICN